MTGQTIILASPRQRALAKQLIDRAPDRAVLNIREATRTLDQNAKMHAMLSDIARAKPDGRVMNVETWKCVMMDACGFKPKWVQSLEGDSVVNTGYRSSRLTKSEFSDLIECISEYGSRHNVRWSEG